MTSNECVKEELQQSGLLPSSWAVHAGTALRRESREFWGVFGGVLHGLDANNGILRLAHAGWVGNSQLRMQALFSADAVVTEASSEAYSLSAGTLARFVWANTKAAAVLSTQVRPFASTAQRSAAFSRVSVPFCRNNMKLRLGRSRKRLNDCLRDPVLQFISPGNVVLAIRNRDVPTLLLQVIYESEVDSCLAGDHNLASWAQLV